MPEADRKFPILQAVNIGHRYGGVLALDGVSCSIGAGEFVAILGSNGAGKSTLGSILAGMLSPSQGQVKIRGKQVDDRDAMIRGGVALVPEGRRLFGQLSIAENLMLAGYGCGCSAAETRRRVQAAIPLLPVAIRDDTGRSAATLSGGEQQMLAIARALMTEPQALIIDEPSMGLAPILVERVYEVLADLHSRGVAIVLIEQIATLAMRHATSILVLDKGQVLYNGRPDASEAQAAILKGYVGQ